MKLKKQQIKNYVDRYYYYIEWSEEDVCFIGKVLEFPSLAAHGNTGEKALKEIKFVVTKVVKSLLKNKENVPIIQNIKELHGFKIDSNSPTGDPHIYYYKVPKPNKKKK